jgi:hypothetical protein
MAKKVSFEGFPCPSQISTEKKLGLDESMNQGDNFDISIIEIGS